MREIVGESGKHLHMERKFPSGTRGDNGNDSGHRGLGLGSRRRFEL